MPQTSPNTPFDVWRIFEEDDFSGTLADLVVSYFDIDVPDASIASGYKSHRLRGDRLQELLAKVATNYQPGGPFLVTHAFTTDTGYVAGQSTLDTQPNALLCLGSLGMAEFGPDGIRQLYVLVYDPLPRPAGTGLQAFVDGKATGPQLPARWVLLFSPAATTPAYTQLPANFVFSLGFLVRAVPADDTSTERFFSANFAGVAPAGPTVAAGDANWTRVDETTLPTPTRPAWENLVGDPQDAPLLPGFVARQVATVYPFLGIDYGHELHSRTVAPVGANVNLTLDPNQGAALDSGAGKTYRVTLFTADATDYGVQNVLRVPVGAVAAPVVLQGGATLDGASSLTLQPGETRLIGRPAGVASGAFVTLWTAGGVASGGGSGAGAIDYTTPVTHTGNATLSAADFGKHHLFTGTGNPLWTVALPDPAGHAGKVLSFGIAAGASGMWAFQAADIDNKPERRLWSKETLMLLCIGTGYTKLQWSPVPLVMTLTLPSGQTLNGLGSLNFTVFSSGNAPAEMQNAAQLGLNALRGGLYQPSLLAYARGGTVFAPIEVIASKNGNYSHPDSTNKANPVVAGAAGSGQAYASLELAANPIQLATGDFLNITYYADAAIDVLNSGAIVPKFSLLEVPTW